LKEPSLTAITEAEKPALIASVRSFPSLTSSKEATHHCREGTVDRYKEKVAGGSLSKELKAALPVQTILEPFL